MLGWGGFFFNFFYFKTRNGLKLFNTYEVMTGLSSGLCVGVLGSLTDSFLLLTLF